jgi:hypothetical protein
MVSVQESHPPKLRNRLRTGLAGLRWLLSLPRGAKRAVGSDRQGKFEPGGAHRVGGSVAGGRSLGVHPDPACPSRGHQKPECDAQRRPAALPVARAPAGRRGGGRRRQDAATVPSKSIPSCGSSFRITYEDAGRRRRSLEISTETTLIGIRCKRPKSRFSAKSASWPGASCRAIWRRACAAKAGPAKHTGGESPLREVSSRTWCWSINVRPRWKSDLSPATTKAT